jgi:hypothetical protein
VRNYVKYYDTADRATDGRLSAVWREMAEEKKRVFEGVARLDKDPCEWIRLEHGPDDISCDCVWLEGLIGRRVRITVEDLGLPRAKVRPVP